MSFKFDSAGPSTNGQCAVAAITEIVAHRDAQLFDAGQGLSNACQAYSTAIGRSLYQVSENDIEIRQVLSIDDYNQCVRLQREAFEVRDLELSPRRHLIVSRSAGGWTLGAFASGEMVGFVHHLVAIGKRDEIIGYSHMMAVAKSVQNKGVGAKLKWAQRERALSEGRTFIKWTWDPMLARNAHFNLNRLGVVVRSYATNYYGTEYSVPTHRQIEGGEIDSDRLFAEWELDSSRVRSLASGTGLPLPEPVASIVIPPDWKTLVGVDPVRAHNEQLRVRSEFHELLAAGFICAGFRRDAIHPKYLFYKEAEMPAD